MRKLDNFNDNPGKLSAYSIIFQIGKKELSLWVCDKGRISKYNPSGVTLCGAVKLDELEIMLEHVLNGTMAVVPLSTFADLMAYYQSGELPAGAGGLE